MSKWYKASELERLNTPMPMDGVNGLPDNHVITVSERVIEIDESELVQNNVSTDTFTLELDAEWDDITPVVIFSNSQGDYKVAYENGPTKIPAAAMAVIGSVDVSVFGLDSTGEVRVVTKAAPSTMDVVESGKFVGQVSSDDVSLLGQILKAVSDANAAAETANTAAKNAGTTVNQLKESVETFLSQSQTSVNNAVSSAEKATSAANTAAQTANTAANNADKSADKADAAATKANTSASRAENAYTTLQPILADISVSGNQPRKTLSGNIVSANDAWPSKPLGIKIKGKTRRNLWVNPSRTSYGVTVTSNTDGSLSISGLATQRLAIYSDSEYTLRPGAAYITSVDKKISDVYSLESETGACFVVVFYDSSGEYITDIIFGFGTNLTRKFVVPEGTSFAHFGVTAFGGQSVSGTYHIMLNEGDTAEPWCPPGLSSVDELSLVTSGKNLLTSAFGEIDYSAHGGIVYGQADMACPVALSGKTVAVSVYVDGKDVTGKTGWALYIGGRPSSVSSYTALTLSPTKKHGTVGNVADGTIIRFYANADFYTGDCALSVQLELGSTATDYEPPNITQTPLPEVELRSLPYGTTDELVIGADGTATVERQTYHELIDGSRGYYFPVEAEGYQYVAVNTAKDKPLNTNITAFSIISDRFASCTGHYEPGLVAITSGGLSGDGRDYIAILFCFEPGTFASEPEAKQWFVDNPTNVWFKGMPETEQLTPVTLPVLPAPTFNVYHDADVPSDTSVEYVRDINIALADLEAKIADLVTKEAANV